MEKIVNLMFKLEKLETNGWLIYTYIASRKGTCFIPLYVEKSQEEAHKKAEDIIKKTGYREILTAPLGHWFSLSRDEKVIPVEIAKDEDKKSEEVRKEIKEEEKNIYQEGTLEWYYYNCFCAVQDKAHIENLEKELNQTLEKIKSHPPPENWEKIFEERLEKRDEGNQARMVINEIKKLLKGKN